MQIHTMPRHQEYLCEENADPCEHHQTMCAHQKTQAAHVKQQVEIDAKAGQHDSDNPDRPGSPFQDMQRKLKNGDPFRHPAFPKVRPRGWQDIR